MTTPPPRISGTPSGDDPRPAPGQGWAVRSRPLHAYPAQPYAAAHPPAVEHRVRERDGARRRVGGVTAALAVAALVGTGAAVVATSANGATTASTSSDTSSSTSGGTSGTSSSVSSSNQSGVASTSGS